MCNSCTRSAEDGRATNSRKRLQPRHSSRQQWNTTQIESLCSYTATNGSDRASARRTRHATSARDSVMKGISTRQQSATSFLVVIMAFLINMMGTTLPTAIYRYYQQQYGFTATVITVIYACYAIGVLGEIGRA